MNGNGKNPIEYIEQFRSMSHEGMRRIIKVTIVESGEIKGEIKFLGIGTVTAVVPTGQFKPSIIAGKKDPIMREISKPFEFEIPAETIEEAFARFDDALVVEGPKEQEKFLAEIRGPSIMIPN